LHSQAEICKKYSNVRLITELDSFMKLKEPVMALKSEVDGLLTISRLSPKKQQ